MCSCQQLFEVAEVETEQRRIVRAFELLAEPAFGEEGVVVGLQSGPFAFRLELADETLADFVAFPFAFTDDYPIVLCLREQVEFVVAIPIVAFFRNRILRVECLLDQSVGEIFESETDEPVQEGVQILIEFCIITLFDCGGVGLDEGVPEAVERVGEFDFRLNRIATLFSFLLPSRLWQGYRFSRMLLVKHARLSQGMVRSVPLHSAHGGAAKHVDGLSVRNGDGPKHSAAFALMAQWRKYFRFQKVETVKNVDLYRFVQSVAEVESHMFFEAPEDGIVLDKLFDFEMGKMLVKIAKLFYVLQSFIIR